jgi:hypothetical protein
MLGVAMSTGAPKGRTHLSADALFCLVRSGCPTIPDHRGDAREISLTDARKPLRLPRCLRRGGMSSRDL